MARDAMRAMMDGLMGTDRDMTGEEKEKNKRTFESSEVDTAFLCGCSPYHLLAETSSEKMLPRSGWDKVQDNFLKNQWDELSQEEKDKYGFEHDTMKMLEDLVGQIDRRIYLNKKKMEDESADLPEEARSKVLEIDAAIKQLQDKANELGEQGDVDSSMACINEAATLKETRDDVVSSARDPNQRVQVVCEVTGAMIPESDVHRLEGGKMYLGWNSMRRKLKEYQEREGGPPKPKPRPSYRERTERTERADRPGRERPADRGGRRSDDRRGRSRDRDRDRRSSRRSRSRSRSRGHGDSRRSSRRDRSRSRDKKKDSRRRRSRSKSRDRKRSSSREKKKEKKDSKEDKEEDDKNLSELEQKLKDAKDRLAKLQEAKDGDKQE